MSIDYLLITCEIISRFTLRGYDKSPMSLMFELNIMIGRAIGWGIPTRESISHQTLFEPALRLELI